MALVVAPGCGDYNPIIETSLNTTESCPDILPSAIWRTDANDRDTRSPVVCEHFPLLMKLNIEELLAATRVSEIRQTGA